MHRASALVSFTCAAHTLSYRHPSPFSGPRARLRGGGRVDSLEGWEGTMILARRSVTEPRLGFWSRSAILTAHRNDSASGPGE